MNALKGMLTLALLLTTAAASALPLLVGTWTGTWAQPPLLPPGSGIVSMTITSQTPSGADDALTGYFDWDCGPAYTCSGREEFTGTSFPT